MKTSHKSRKKNPIKFKDDITYVYHFDSPLGLFYTTSDLNHNILQLIFSKKQIEYLVSVKKIKSSKGPSDWQKEFDLYFSGLSKKINLPYALTLATPFQKKVYQELLKIPYGKVSSYLDIAKKVASKNHARAIGGACNKNPLPLIIPCHRVLGSNGGLTGFAFGIDSKSYLLNLEKQQGLFRAG